MGFGKNGRRRLLVFSMSRLSQYPRKSNPLSIFHPRFLRGLFIFSDACRLVLGWTLFVFCGACLSGASCPVLCLASVRLDLARLGVYGFVYFFRRKNKSAAGPRSGNAKSNVSTVVVGCFSALSSLSHTLLLTKM